MTLKAIEKAAMKLPSRSRSRLAASLLTSLDTDNPADSERLLVEEANRRYREYRRGRTGSMPAKEAIAAARAVLRAGAPRA
jgi:hypothetical protein